MLQDFEFAHQYGELSEEYIKKNVSRSMELINKMSKTIDDFRHFFVSNKQEENIDIAEIVKEAANAFDEQLSSLSIRL